MGVSFLREIATNPARAAVMLLKLLAVLVSFVALCAAQERPRFPPAFMTDVRSRVARTLCVLLYLLAFSQLETVIDYIDREGPHRMVGQGELMHAVGYLLTVIMQARELRISSRTKEYTPRYSMLKTHPDLEKRTTITLSIATTWDWNSITTSKYSQCKSFILLLSIRSSNTPYTRCRADQVFGDIYPYFDWVEYAAYNGQRAMGEERLDFWLIMVSQKTCMIVLLRS